MAKKDAQTNKFQLLKQAMNSKFLERQELVDGMLTALISGEPLIQIGPPGTAKSAICQEVCKALSGNFFSWMLTKFTVPEELFGPLSLKGLEQDKYVRVTTGKLPEAHIGFLDEVGKASSSISNTLLTILNEKVFYNGDKPQQVPLQVLYGASNEVPQSEELSAFYDRFVLRYFVQPVSQEQSIRNLFTGNRPQGLPFAPISIKELEAARVEAFALSIPDVVIDALVAIRREIANEGIQVSDRKWVQATRVLRAYAFIQGHTEVTLEDLDVLNALLWSTPDQIAKVRKVINKVSNPLGEKIMQITDAVRDLVDSIGKGGDAIEAFKKVKHAVKELDKLGDASTNAKLDQAQQWVKSVQRDIAKKHLDLED